MPRLGQFLGGRLQRDVLPRAQVENALAVDVEPDDRAGLPELDRERKADVTESDDGHPQFGGIHASHGQCRILSAMHSARTNKAHSRTCASSPLAW
jgi:hypothetical protein